jgi:hypothetical protein
VSLFLKAATKSSSLLLDYFFQERKVIKLDEIDFILMVIKIFFAGEEFENLRYNSDIMEH